MLTGNPKLKNMGIPWEENIILLLSLFYSNYKNKIEERRNINFKPVETIPRKGSRLSIDTKVEKGILIFKKISKR